MAATAVVAVGPVLVSGAAAHAAAATRFVATKGSDTTSASAPNTCLDAHKPCKTVQRAVDAANPGDTVSVAAGTYAESVFVAQSLTITGAGATRTTVSGDGQGDPALHVQADDATVASVSIRNLALSGNTSASGLEVQSSTATLVHGSVSGNGRDGIDVLDGGRLTLTSSTVSGNSGTGVDVQGGAATLTGAQISHDHAGGVIAGPAAKATVRIARSTLDGNSGTGVEAEHLGTVTVSQSTIARSSPSAGTGVAAAGGGLLALGGTLTARESTVYGNTSFGVAVDSSASRPAHAQVANSTITATGKGGSLPGGVVETGAKAELSLSGTIDATNQVPDCTVPVTDAGYNLDSDGSCGLHATGSRPHAAARLGTLGAHGGPTQTVLPGLRSAARNAIRFGKAGCLKAATDQRGRPRREPAGGKCDIGSVEVTVVNPKLHAKVSGHRHHGSYHGRVTVKYRCRVGSAPLTHSCPRPTHLRSKGRHRITKTIRAVDGGTAKVRLRITIT